MSTWTHTQATLTLAGAQRLLDLALQAANDADARICAAVVDASGQLLAFRRMDGAGRISIQVAQGKARTAALFGKPLEGFEAMIDGGHASMLGVPDAVMLAGGLPVGHPVVGALGISGSTGPGDLAIARRAVGAFSNEL